MSNKYVFIDRDGVINKDPEGCTKCGYVSLLEEVDILPGVSEAIKKLTDAGYKSVIISNQQGVGKGYFSEESLKMVTDKMLSIVEKDGGKISGIYYCTHTKEEDCSCRKPKEGLFYIAQKELGIPDFKDKFYIGDTERDMVAGKKVGLESILVLSGKSSKEDAENWENKPDHICEDLLEAVEKVII
ncbi:MAG: HAD family hydrolase [Candidatus Omnitrophica bacterium]|nr:HAD family hydrolase [Candidatus Omnitrophota bacterium]